MAKAIDKVLKLQIRGGAANPSPPVGPALGAAGVNIMEFQIFCNWKCGSNHCRFHII